MRQAGLLRIRRGPGGADLARPPAEITLAEVWAAMRRPGLPLLPTYPGPQRGVFDAAEGAMERKLAEPTLLALLDRLGVAERGG
ncbi:MAG: Rrf2 family transcriptional regulator [Roseomonas sp.]|nr:Rrf2 family transcriptional regulator [Roseomonas sp.]